MDTSQLPELDELTDARLSSDPAPLIAEIHARNPIGVFRNSVEDGLAVTRYQLLRQIAKHGSFQAQNRSSRSTGPSNAGALTRLFDNHPVFMNEPLHMPVHQVAYRLGL